MQLAKFNAMASSENMRAAAADLSISQPAMSKAIQALEQVHARLWNDWPKNSASDELTDG